jgi:hypothetical protein
MITDNIYKFYELPEEKRIELIGQSITEHSQYRKNTRVYYPVGLSNDCFNYGYQQGLIGVIKPVSMILGKKQLLKYRGDSSWIKIYAFSPDDLDLGLHFCNNRYPDKLYHRILDYLDQWTTTFFDMSYRDILLYCQKDLGGEIGD